MGKVFKYGDDVNTDVIFPGKYTYTIDDPNEMAKHAMEDLDPDFVNRVEDGDIIVAGKNFGMGSSREQAVTCLVYSGIKAIIAKSFARIFFRNAINNGLPAIIHPEAASLIEEGDRVEVDLKRGIIKTKDKEYSFEPYPERLLQILEEGSLVEWVKKRLGN
jgi:3-isopropylmalate/(R)-2-methylmalate dehydratase small subunit